MQTLNSPHLLAQHWTLGINAGPPLKHNSNHYWYFDLDAISRNQKQDA